MAKTKSRPSATTASKMFEAGRHLEVVAQVSFPDCPPEDAMALIGSLAFLGRIQEAVEIWKLASRDLKANERARARFALSLAYTRTSKFKQARIWLKANLSDKETKASAETFQGIAVYHYYLGRFEKAALFAQKALRQSLREKNAYVRAFATDLAGHALVQTGKRSAGLKRLEEARAQAGRTDLANPFSIARLVYEAEAGLRPETIVDELYRGLREAREDTFTSANLVLELSRQLTLRGKWKEARELLDRESQAIYSFENRRHEATLQLRLAEIAYRQGETFTATHFLQASRRCLIKIADKIYELRILGLEAKIERICFKREPSPDHLARLAELSRSHPNPINSRILSRSGVRMNVQIDNDPLGDLIDLKRHDPLTFEENLLKRGYLGLWPESQNFAPGESTFVILESGAYIACSKEGVFRSSIPLSAISLKILERLMIGAANKESLIESVWGYRYEPLRHDAVVYAALASLRKALGRFAEWIHTSEDGWELSKKVGFVSRIRRPKPNAPILPKGDDILILAPALNLRQNRALSLETSWTVPGYRRFFKVSTMTAWRDLDELVDKRYLTRIGRARATVYVKAAENLRS